MNEAGESEEHSLLSAGRAIFALSVIALGVETWVCANRASHELGPQHSVLPLIPWLPAIPAVAYLFGAIWVGCGAGMLWKNGARLSAITFGSLFVLCALIL